MAMVQILAMLNAREEDRRQYEEKKKNLPPITKCSNCRSSNVSEEMLFSANRKRNRKRKRSNIDQDSVSKETTSLPPCSKLPEELIGMVGSKMKSADDCACFRSVCMSWKNGFDKIWRLSLPRQLPLLVSQKARPFRFHRVPELRGTSTSSHNMKLNNIPANCRCIGSTEGWLVFVDHLVERNDWSDSILLVNPFREKRIRLPILKQDYRNSMAPTETVRKVVLSANPIWNKDYVVMVIYGYDSRFAFCRSSDETWTKIGTQDFIDIDDVIYYRNQIHIIQRYGCVFAVSDISSSPVLECVARKKVSRAVAVQLYLVDLSGDLLLVQREVNSRTNNTIGFEVFKMDPMERVFTQVEDLGDHLLFLGSISSISVLASHFSGCYCSNRIYFDRDYNAAILPLSPWDMGYFCLNDRYIRQICPAEAGNNFFWIEPQVATSLK